MFNELFGVLNLLKIRTRIDIFGTDKFKVIFGLKYTCTLTFNDIVILIESHFVIQNCYCKIL